MEKDYQYYGEEIDKIKEELSKISEMLSTLWAENNKNKEALSTRKLKNVQPMHDMHPDKMLSAKMDELCVLTDEKGTTGYITYLGVFSSGDEKGTMQSNWIRNEVSTDELLKLIESGIAEKVLNCIGNNDRLNLLLQLLKAPKTVANLVEDCGYNSTGQVYNLLKPLLAANLIQEDKSERGCYSVIPYRVQGIIMVLTGISDMLDPAYTEGNWENVES